MMEKILLLFLLLSQPKPKGTVKIAFLHHGNQTFADNGAYALIPGDPGYVGNSYHRILDSHFYYNIPVDIHISGPLAQSYAWLKNDNDLLNRLKNDLVCIVASVYGQNIMPYADPEMNKFALWYKKIVDSCLIKKPGWQDYPTVIWIPERVWKSQLLMPYSLIEILNQEYGKYDSQGRWIAPCIILDDNVHEWYPHTFPSGDTCYNPNKVHIMYDDNGYYVFVIFIDSYMRHGWVWNDVSDPDNWVNQHLWSMANSWDQWQIALYGDDWEKAAGVAGWDFGQAGAPSNSYDNNIAWAATQDWVQCIHVCEAAKWWGVDAIYDENPLNDPPEIKIHYAAYSELHDWTGGNYDNWYNDFHHTIAYGIDTANISDLSGNGVKGDYEDLWKYGYNRLMGNIGPSIPDLTIAKLGWITLMGMLYETAWHTGPGGELVYWGKNLWNHTRYAGFFAEATAWLAYIADTITIAKVDSGDYDFDGEYEYAIYNNKLFAIFEKRGGRALVVVTSDTHCVVGNLMTNWGGEGDWDDGGHPGLFHDSQGENSWFTADSVSSGSTAVLLLCEKYDWSGEPASDLQKEIRLKAGKSYFEVKYQSTWDNWTKAGVTPGLWNMLLHGYNLKFIWGLSPNGWMYAGYEDTFSTVKACFMWGSGQGLTYHNLCKMSSGAELIELGGKSGTYTIFFYAGKGTPEIDSIGPGDLEGPIIYGTSQTPPHSILPEDTVWIQCYVVDPSDVKEVFVRYTDNNWASSYDVQMQKVDDNLYKAFIPPHPYGTKIEYCICARDTFLNESWDNNFWQNYSYTVGLITFEMDGQIDRIAYEISQNEGMHLWIYYYADSCQLYVATEAATGEIFHNDHFIFISLNPCSLLISPPWAKRGKVGYYDVYLADESESNFEGWFKRGDVLFDTINCASSTQDGVLEGVIDLDKFYGFRPETVYIAVGSYGTWDGDYLQWQVPPSDTVPADTIISADEFVILPLQRLRIEEKRILRKPEIKIYPNPTKGKFTIFYTIPEETKIKISLYDVNGRLVQILKEEKVLPGRYILKENLRLPSGIYFVRIEGKGLIGIQKLIYIK